MANIEELRAGVVVARGAFEAGDAGVNQARENQEKVRATAAQIANLMVQIAELMDGPLREGAHELGMSVAQAGQEYTTAYTALERIAEGSENSLLQRVITRSALSAEQMRGGEERGAADCVASITEGYRVAYARMSQAGTAIAGMAHALSTLDYHFQGAQHHSDAGLEELRVYESELGQ
jgi:hypothetical protein